MKSSLKPIFLLICFLFISKSYSSTAYPGLVEFKQPDGEKLLVKIKGDEFQKWSETEDGYTLLYDQKGFLNYAVIDKDSSMIASGVRAKSKSDRNTENIKFLNEIKPGLFFGKKQKEEAVQRRLLSTKQRQPFKKSGSTVGIIGKKKFLVILVDFPDRKFIKSKDSFNKLMNENGYSNEGAFGSVRDFYLENSFGQLDLTSDIFGVYTAKNPLAYYGQNASGGQDIRPSELISEILAMSDTEIDFSKYDNDGDGTMDGLHVIYAGYGEESGGGSDCIWAHKFNVSSIRDGVNINSYSCSPELRMNTGDNITHIGVICHEIGHVLGCMDFYDTDYGLNGKYEGTGRWDLMAAGNWNNGGATPAHFNPYIKVVDFGWTKYTELSNAETIILSHIDKDGICRLQTGDEEEYFILEYRSQTGFDRFIPYHGLIIYRANIGRIYNTSGSNGINTSHPLGLYPVTSESIFELPNSTPSSYGDINSASCPFPGLGSKTEFTDWSLPSSKSFSGKLTGIPITYIEEDVATGFVKFDVAGGDGDLPRKFRVAEVDKYGVLLEWKKSAKQDVMLLYADNDKFGIPDNRVYYQNEQINGGGKVLYYGSDSVFRYSINEYKKCYFKLYAFDNNLNKWSKGIPLVYDKGKMVKLPYSEEFSGNDFYNDWKSDAATSFNWFQSESNIRFSFSDFEYLNSRIVSPVVDLTAYEHGVLTLVFKNTKDRFDNNNFLNIEYKVDGEQEWTSLVFVKEYSNDYITIKCILPGKIFCRIALNGIHDLGDSRGLIAGNEAAALFVDKLSVIGVNGNSFIALPAENIGNKSVMLTGLLVGNIGFDKYGFEWRTAGVGSWSRTELTNGARSIIINGLLPGQLYEFRSWSQWLVSDETLEFGTIFWSKGTGSFSDPFILSSIDDLIMLSDIVAGGNDCKNLHFKMVNDISFNNISFKPIGGFGTDMEFNGIFDGGGYKISDLSIGFDKSTINVGLFGILGKQAVVKNLVIYGLNLKGSEWGGIAGRNYGLISNCTIGNSTYENILNLNYIYTGGLVGVNNGCVLNCTNSSNIKTGSNLVFGGIVGLNNGYVVNCYNYGKLEKLVDGTNSLGGIVGKNDIQCKDGILQSGTISGCVNKGDLNIMYPGATIGGICAVNNSIISECVNERSISSVPFSVDIGGIAGMSSGVNSNAQIKQCYNHGNINRNFYSSSSYFRSNIGGLVGLLTSSVLEKSHFFGSIEDGFKNFGDVGTVFGKVSESFVRNVDNKVESIIFENKAVTLDYISSYSDEARLGGYLITDLDLNIHICGFEIREQNSDNVNFYAATLYEGIWQTEIKNLKPETKYEFRFVAANDDNKYLGEWKDFYTFFEQEGTSLNPFEIASSDDLNLLSALVRGGRNFSGRFFKQLEHIDLEGSPSNCWLPVGGSGRAGQMTNFKGIYDGNNKVIFNLWVDTENRYAGLFGVGNCTVKNLGIMGNCKVRSYLADDYYVGTSYNPSASGGIIGNIGSYQGNIENCFYIGDVEGPSQVGGIAGHFNGTNLKNCFARGSIIATGSKNVFAAGIAGGTAYAGFSNSYFVGSVSSTSKVGKISGITNESTSDSLYSNPVVNNCYYNNTSGGLKGFGQFMEKAEMKSVQFISDISSGLDASPWKSDSKKYPFNEGFPVLSSRQHTDVLTLSPSDINFNSAFLRARIVPGLDEISGKGFEWLTSSYEFVPRISMVYSEDFLLKLDNLLPKSSYNVRAYIVIDNDTIYGNWITFKTKNLSSLNNIKEMPDLFSVYYDASRRVLVLSCNKGSEITVSDIAGRCISRFNSNLNVEYFTVEVCENTVYVVSARNNDLKKHLKILTSK